MSIATLNYSPFCTILNDLSSCDDFWFSSHGNSFKGTLLSLYSGWFPPLRIFLEIFEMFKTTIKKNPSLSLIVWNKNLLSRLPPTLKSHACAEMFLIVVLIEKIAQDAVISRSRLSDWHSCRILCGVFRVRNIPEEIINFEFIGIPFSGLYFASDDMWKN